MFLIYPLGFWCSFTEEIWRCFHEKLFLADSTCNTKEDTKRSKSKQIHQITLHIIHDGTVDTLVVCNLITLFHVNNVRVLRLFQWIPTLHEQMTLYILMIKWTRLRAIFRKNRYFLNLSMKSLASMRSLWVRKIMKMIIVRSTVYARHPVSVTWMVVFMTLLMTLFTNVFCWLTLFVQK